MTSKSPFEINWPLGWNVLRDDVSKYDITMKTSLTFIKDQVMAWNFETSGPHSKGQLIAKGLFGVHSSSVDRFSENFF